MVVGGKMPWLTETAHAAVQVEELTFTITDALKDMVTDNAINPAKCFFWIYKEATLPAESPGPLIFTREGADIELA